MTGAHEAACERGEAGRDPARQSRGSRSTLRRVGSRGLRWLGAGTRSPAFVLVVLVLLGALFFAPAIGGAQSGEITDCTQIEDSGTYTLAQNITADQGLCIEIAANDVVIDGQGHHIDGAGNGAIVRDGDLANHTVRNVTIDGAATGIELDFTDGATVENVTITDNSNNAIELHEATDVTLRNVVVQDVDGDAIKADYESTDVTATNLTVGHPEGAGTTLDLTGQDFLMAEVSSPQSAPSGNVSLDKQFHLAHVDGFVDVEVPYDDADVQGVDDDTLAVFADDNGWTELDSSVDQDAQTVSATGLSTNDADYGVFGEEGPYFDVTIDEKTSSVVEGETVSVEATVNNSGLESGNGTIALTADGVQRASETVSLNVGEETTVELNWTAGDGDAGLFDAAVESEQDSETWPLRVADPDGPIWETDADWSAGSHDRTVSDGVGDRENDTVRLGYPASESGLVSYWPFDEGSVTTAVDAAGSNDGVHEGSGIALGRPGLLNSSRYEFDGTSRINVSDDPSLRLQNGMAISLWVNTTELGSSGRDDNQMYLLDKGSSYYSGYQLLDDGIKDGDVVFRVHGEDRKDAVVPRKQVNDGTWHHLVGVRDGDAIRLYLDGELVDETTGSSLDADNRDLKIGSSDNDDGHYEGDMDELRIYNRSLSDAEVQALYETTHNGTHTAGWRPLEEPLDVDSLELNASATVSTGDATVYVESDTDDDGAVEQTSDPISLSSGTDTYAVENLSADADTVRLRTEFETTDLEQTPVVDRAALEETATFQVSDVVQNGSAVAGEALAVNATVENVGDQSGNQNLTLEIDGSGTTADETTVELDSGERETVSLEWQTTGGDAGDHTATVASDDDNASTTVTVDAPAHFTVTNVDTDTPIVENETLHVDATIENTGDRAAEQAVNLSVGNESTVVGTNETTLELNGSESATVPLNWSTEVGDAGDYDATVSTANESATRDVSVVAEDDFQVTIDDTSSPVEPTAALHVNATVENLGDQNATQDVNLTVNGSSSVDSVALPLDGNESESVNLTWPTTHADVGNHTVSVTSEDGSDTSQVRVLEPANLSVSVEDPAPVLEGDPVDVNASVTNVGELNGTQNLNLSVNGSEVEDRNVTVNASETKAVTLTWSDTDGERGGHAATVASANDSDEADVRVDAPANLSVDVVDYDDEVVGGNGLNVTANVTNVGDRTANQTLNLSVNGTDGDVETRPVSIDSGQSSNETLTWATTVDDAGDYEATFASANDSDAVDVGVDAPPNFSVEIVEYDEAVVQGGSFDVTANVTNVGDVNGSQRVALEMFGQIRDGETVAVAARESKNVTLSWQSVVSSAGNYTAAVESDDDRDSVDVRVNAPANLSVDVTSFDATVTEGEWLDATATVTNVGDRAATQTLTFSVNGTERANRTVALDADETKDVTLGWNTTTGDAGDYTASFASENDSDEVDVTVAEPSGGGLPAPPGPEPSPNFQVAIDGTNSPVGVGEAVAVTTTVSNVGDASGTESVALRRAGATLDDRDVSLAANESETVVLEWTPDAGHVGSNRLAVESGASSDVRYVTVESAPVVDPPPVELTVEETTAPLDAGRPLSVTATVEASEDVESTVELRDFGGDGVASEPVDLDAGGSTTVTLTWQTAVEDAGSGAVTVASEGASASADVRLREPAAFTGTIESVTSPVDVDEVLTVQALVESEASAERTSDVVLEIDGAERDVRTVTLAPGDAERVTLEWTPSEPDVGERELTLRAGADATSRTVTVQRADGGGFFGGYAPEWTGTAVDYAPTQQDTHVGGFLWLTALMGTVGGYLVATRSALDARLLGVTLLVAAVRTSTDVLHATVESLTLEPLLALNASLELTAGLLFLAFAAASAEQYRLLDRRGVALLGAIGLGGTALAASNPAHGLVFSNVSLVEGPFTYASVDHGPLGWVLLTVTLGSLLCSVALLGRSFLAGTDPTWRPVGVLGAGLCLATVVVAMSVFQRGPLPQYDYTGAGVAGFLLVATTAVGHELHRIKRDAQRSLIEDLEDPIVITNDAREVVEYNAAAARLLPTIEVEASFRSLVGYEPEWPAPGETTTNERNLASILPSRTDGGARDPAFDPDDPSDGDPAGGDPAGGDPSDDDPAAGDPADGDPPADDDPHAEDDPLGEAPSSEGELAGEGTSAGESPEPAGVGDREAGATTEEPIAAPAAADAEAGASASESPEPGDGTADGLVDRSDDATAELPPTDVHYLVQTTSVTVETGDTIGYTVRFTDVSELTQRTEELARKNAQLEQVASTISHDLRNPLTVADGYLEIASEAVPEPDRPGSAADEESAEVAAPSIAEHLEPIRSSLQRMEAIIEDVLALARSSEPVTIEEDLRFAAVVEDAWRIVDTGRATLFVESDGAIDADSRRLQRILENLFRNAVDHVGEDVAVVVGLSEDGFYVADDGPGIPEGRRDDVFEQGHTSSQDGTGLGLSIVTQLARAHGWSVSIDPEYDGARFVFEGCDVDLEDDASDE